MTNEEWFYFDDETGEPHLTDKAPKEARESFEKYMELVVKLYSRKNKPLQGLKSNVFISHKKPI